MVTKFILRHPYIEGDPNVAKIKTWTFDFWRIPTGLTQKMQNLQDITIIIGEYQLVWKNHLNVTLFKMWT